MDKGRITTWPRVAGLPRPGRGQDFEQPGDLPDRDLGVLLAGLQPAISDLINRSMLRQPLHTRTASWSDFARQAARDRTEYLRPPQ
jgi:hypothetical protein